MDMILHGREAAETIAEETKKKLRKLAGKGISVKLACVRVGGYADAVSYERSLEKSMAEYGIAMEKYVYPEDIGSDEFIKAFTETNEDPSVHGILLMKPLPDDIDEEKIRNIINPCKDIDGIGTVNTAKLFFGDENGFAPCCAEAVIELLKYYEIKISGKNVVIVGRSMVVGKPLAFLMMKDNATVTVCHRHTKELAGITKNADIVVTAIGKPRFFGPEFFSGHSIVVDVGVNADGDGKICGDVNYRLVCDRVKCISPVPGGVGNVTTALIAKHIVQAAELQNG